MPMGGALVGVNLLTSTFNGIFAFSDPPQRGPIDGAIDRGTDGAMERAAFEQRDGLAERGLVQVTQDDHEGVRIRAQLLVDSLSHDLVGLFACAEDERSGAPGHFVRQMEEFFASIAQGREPFTSGPCERATLAAILAGYESMRTGKPVAL